MAEAGSLHPAARVKGATRATVDEVFSARGFPECLVKTGLDMLAIRGRCKESGRLDKFRRS
jgi:hypothetical protein